MTGSASPGLFAGVHTFRYRQSSLTPSGALKSFAAAASCMQLKANDDACFTPVHALTGCGAFQRSAPTGGAAKGMPLNDEMPFATTPATFPPVTSASRIWADAPAVTRRTAAHAAMIEDLFIQFTFRTEVILSQSRSMRSIYAQGTK